MIGSRKAQFFPMVLETEIMKVNHEKDSGDQHTRSSTENDQRERVGSKKDFWDDIADDVAKGYGASGSAKDIRNRDQEPNYNRRGDEVD